MTYVGIDVSKDHLDVCIRPTNKRFRVENSKTGVTSLIRQIGTEKSTRVVVESTGGYERTLAQECWDKKIWVAIVNPKRIRDFGRANGRMAKTDRIDAELIALAAEKLEFRETAAPSEQQKSLTAMVRRRLQCTNMITQERNRSQICSDEAIRKTHLELIAFLLAAIKVLDKQIEKSIDSHPQRTGARKIQEIPGVGNVVAATLLTEVPELGTLARKPIASLVGLAPMSRDSGSSVRGNRSITGGRACVRRVLYMATLHAIRRFEPIQSMYARLRKAGKPGKVAIVACMRKLLTMLNGIMRDTMAIPTAPS